MATVDDAQVCLIGECLYEARYIEAHLVMAWLGPVEDRERNVREAITWAASVAETLGMSCFKREDWKDAAIRDFGDTFPPKPPRRPDSPDRIPAMPSSGPHLSGGAMEAIPTNHDYLRR